LKTLLKTAVLLASVLSSLLPIHALAAAEERWVTWRNERFAYSICYPSAVFPVFRESPQRHGIAMDADDSAELIAAAIPYTHTNLAEPIRMEKERLTHIALVASGRDLTNGDNWFVVSGTRVDQVLYTKAIRSGHRLIAFRFRYPESLAAKYAPIVERMSECLELTPRAPEPDAD